ncbi:MAG TPA: methyltransferase domain-containing protein [Jatrophihabitans sp.]|uniref:methyltransferase domain-containing protein n=1 Tax=Jatrophihabitans sp. TaxID=1932789 RepID=UPI002F16132D
MTEQARQPSGQRFDVVVVGGGAAGLSAALVLARARRAVAVIDAGQPRNAPAAGVHGLLGREGISPAELVQTGRREVQGYGGLVLDGEVGEACRREDGFEVRLADGRVLVASRLLVTTGLVDELPDVAGVRQRWGRDVLHCPYCHGWEVRDQAVGILASGPMAVHQALLFRQLTSDLVLFTHTAPALTAEQAEQLAARGIRVVDGEVVSLQVEDDRLTGVRLRDGAVVARQALVVGPRLVARSELLAGLGVSTVEHPMGIGEHIVTDAGGLTTAAGVWAAGNVTDLSAQVSIAIAGGQAAAAAINADLIAEQTQQAVAAYRHDAAGHHAAGHDAAGHDAAGHDGAGHHDAGHDGAESPEQWDQAFWDERYRSKASLWSHEPNRYLVSEASELAPGTALDAGCGEGADAIWLARQGWQVTAVDLSSVALERAAANAAAAGEQVAGRIDWQHADITGWDPGRERFDLVTSQYLHLPPGQREPLFQRLAAAVRPGGSLIIAAHHPSDLHTTIRRPKRPELYFTGDQIAALLDPALWQIVTNAEPERTVSDHEGGSVTIRDTVLRARRRD